MTVLYFDCASGASGDMILGALLDAGVPEDVVRSSLDALGLTDWSLDVSSTTKNGIRASRADVSVTDADGPRTYREMRSLLESSPLPAGVRERALTTIETLARAEARIHGLAFEEVHFHEVGTTDAMIDIVGACAALEHLAPDAVFTSAIATGMGIVVTEHGELPLPVPAVTEILQSVGAPIVAKGSDELTTPTGAAILAAAGARFGELPTMRIMSSGYGAGRRDLEWPNVIRVLVGESAGTSESDMMLLETNLDDLNPELIPYVIESLLNAGARDAWTTPIVMKKGRPAVTLSVLCATAHKERMVDILFKETTTLGVRVQSMTRDVLARDLLEVEVEGFRIGVKRGHRAGEVLTVAPEYEDCAEAARKSGLPLKAIYDMATEKARKL
jgi:uncharacterized protein (TIGR00299 family) protein